MLPTYALYTCSPTPPHPHTQQAAQAMVEQQSDMDVVVRKAINTLLSTSNAFEMMQLQFADQPINSTGQQVGVGVTSLTEDLVTRAPPAAASAGKAVVEDWECLRVGLCGGV